VVVGGRVKLQQAKQDDLRPLFPPFSTIAMPPAIISSRQGSPHLPAIFLPLPAKHYFFPPFSAFNFIPRDDEG
jgi:hypothetical protein